MNGDYISFSGKVPENYDQLLGPFLFEPYAVDLVSRIKGQHVRRILELACGTGRVTRHLREMFPPPVELIATDFNPGMLAIARGALDDGSIQFSIADAQALPFPEHHFDVVLCQFGYMFVPDKSKAFHEAFRVLREEGQLVFNTWDALEKNPATLLADEALKEYFHTTGPSFFSIPFSMYNENDIRQLVEGAGFKKIHIEHKMIPWVGSSAADVAKGLIIGTPAYDEISKRDPEAPASITEITAKKLRERYGEGSISTETSALVCTAFK